MVVYGFLMLKVESLFSYFFTVYNLKSGFTMVKELGYLTFQLFTGSYFLSFVRGVHMLLVI